MAKKVTGKKWIGLIVLFALLIIFPLVITDAYILHIAIIALIYSILASSLNLLSGYTGLLSLGHQAFYGIGGYTSALLMMRLGFPFLLALLSAGVFSMLCAWFIGKITFRLRSAFFAISTIAFAKILELVCVNWVGLTEGPMGLNKIPPPSIGSFIFDTRQKQYYLILVLAAICIYGAYRIIHSHVGRVFRCVADAEYVCKASGTNVNRYLMIAVMAGGFMAGIAGAFYAHYQRIISPDMFYFQISINMIVMVVAGGLGTFAGPVIGAVLFTAAPELLRFSQEYSYLLYGIILIIIILFLPGGVVSLFTKVNNRFTRMHDKRKPGAATPAQAKPSADLRAEPAALAGPVDAENALDLADTAECSTEVGMSNVEEVTEVDGGHK